MVTFRLPHSYSLTVVKLQVSALLRTRFADILKGSSWSWYWPLSSAHFTPLTTLITSTYSFNFATKFSDFNINRGSLASIRSPSLSCAHWKNCIPAFAVLIIDLTLNAICEYHLSWLIPWSTFGRISRYAFGTAAWLDEQKDCSCSLWRPTRL